MQKLNKEICTNCNLEENRRVLPSNLNLDSKVIQPGTPRVPGTASYRLVRTGRATVRQNETIYFEILKTK